MATRELLASATEKLRTDPAGLAGMALGISGVIMHETRELPKWQANAVSLGSAALLTASLVHLGNMFSYAKETEESLLENGFDDTDFRMRAYCLRQASKAVCQKHGQSEKFDELHNKLRGRNKLRLPFLPHI